MGLRISYLNRLEDESHVSGTGIVAEGCLFSSGECVIHWFGEHGSINIYHSLNDLILVHGHHGKTKIVWATSLEETPSKEELKKDEN